MSKDDWKDPFEPRKFVGNQPNRGFSWGSMHKPREPEPTFVPEQWPTSKQRTDKVFAKSCASGQWCRTDAGTAAEPASNFGKVMVAGAMLMPSANTTIATPPSQQRSALIWHWVALPVAGSCSRGSIGHYGARAALPVFLCWGCYRRKWETARPTPTKSCAL